MYKYLAILAFVSVALAQTTDEPTDAPSMEVMTCSHAAPGQSSESRECASTTEVCYMFGKGKDAIKGCMGSDLCKVLTESIEVEGGEDEHGGPLVPDLKCCDNKDNCNKSPANWISFSPILLVACLLFNKQ